MDCDGIEKLIAIISCKLPNQTFTQFPLPDEFHRAKQRVQQLHHC